MLAEIKIAEIGTADEMEDYFTPENIHKRDVDNNTLLHYACLAGNMDSVKTLLNKGLYVDATNVEGHTPICDAAINGSEHVIKLLLSNGANVNPPSYWGSPLIYAVRNNHINAIVALIDSGADINGCDRTGACAIHIAIENIFYEALEHILLSGADPNRRVRLTTPLHMAAKMQNRRMVYLLLIHGAFPTPIDKDGFTPSDLVPKSSPIFLLLNAYSGHVPSLQFLARLTIKTWLPSFRRQTIGCLELPRFLCDYLTFKH